MYRTEYEANAQGFKCAPLRKLRARAYPPMVRYQFKLALALSIAARVALHFA